MPNQTTGVSRDHVNRARRYVIGTILRYRVRGERGWREGMMENISTSGVLLRAAGPLALDAVVEMRFLLPAELNGERAAEILCRGPVVRSSHCGVPGGPVNIAVKIAHSRFLRQAGKNEMFADEPQKSRI